jgi:acetoin utilization deacetylase AcuC-like enzyme
MPTTFIVSDPRYELHCPGPGGHERPERCRQIRDALEKAKLLRPDNTLLASKPVSKRDLRMCHRLEYIEKVEKECLRAGEKPCMLSTGDVQVKGVTWDVARLAVGGVFAAVDKVFSQEDSNAFCCIRPPGHHAQSAVGRGFCVFNNVALAAEHARRTHGIKRVAIIDFDVHHGNGTQEIFENDPDALFVSVHSRDLYPDDTGRKTECGIGAGEGMTVNRPIEEEVPYGPRMISSFGEVLVNKVRPFRPQCVLLSAGFDAGIGDPLGGQCAVKNEEYKIVTRMIMEEARLAKAPLVSVLEGGYGPGLADAAAAHVEALSDVTRKSKRTHKEI